MAVERRGRANPEPPPIPFEEAVARVVAHCRLLDAEEILTEGADARVLASDLTAPWPLPPYDHAALDGFAVRSESTATACVDRPTVLPIVGQIGAGDPAGPALPPSAVMEVATGAPIPPGADAMIPYEAADRFDDSITVRKPARAGANIRRRGEDIDGGEPVARAGDRVDAGLMGLLAACGWTKVAVRRRPHVAIVATGNELRPASQASSDRVTDTNSPVIACLARQAGARVTPYGIVPDELAPLRESVRAAVVGADLVVTIGGASVGPRDRVHDALTDMSAELVFRRVAVKPGKPCGLYRLGECLVLSLPGNPSAAALMFELLGVTALAVMQGEKGQPSPYLRAVTTGAVRTNAQSTTLLRGVVHSRGTHLFFTPSLHRGSANLRAAMGSNAIAVIEPREPSLPEGTEIACVLRGLPLVGSSAT